MITTVGEMPSHNHDWRIRIGGFDGGWNIESGSGGETINRNYMKPEGGDLPHNNTHPVVVTYTWERIG